MPLLSMKFCDQHLGQVDRTIKLTSTHRSILCRAGLGPKEMINQDLSKQRIKKRQNHSRQFHVGRRMSLLVGRGNGGLKKG